MPRSTVQRSTGRAPGRFVNHQRTETHVIVPVLDDLMTGLHPEPGSVMRIRLHRVSEPKGSAYGQSIIVVTETFLDGVTRTSTTSDGRLLGIERTPVATSLVPVRTKDFVDFGRLDSAVQALVAEAQRYTDENPPSDAQAESLLASYQAILAWREKASAALASAEGKIDIAGALMRRVMAL